MHYVLLTWKMKRSQELQAKTYEEVLMKTTELPEQRDLRVESTKLLGNETGETLKILPLHAVILIEQHGETMNMKTKPGWIAIK